MNPEENPENSQFNTPLKQIRTFQGDVADALKNENQSLVTIARAEKAHAPETPQETPGTNKTLWFTLGSLVLLLLGGAGAYWAYNTYLVKTAPPEIVAPENRFVSSATETKVDASDLTRETLINVLKDEAAKDVAPGEIHQINFIPEITTTQFLTKLETQAPSALVRALDPLFMYGVLGGETPSDFLILKVRSYENAFAGELEWEPNLASDLGPLFATSEKLKTIPPQSVFLDDTDRNKDIRVLKDASSTPLLLYSFLGRDFLIITDNLDTLRTLIDRLTREKLTR